MGTTKKVIRKEVIQLTCKATHKNDILSDGYVMIV